MKINILTTRPNFFIYFFLNGLINKLITQNVCEIKIYDIENYGDSSYGGHDGIVLNFVPFVDCLKKNSLLNTTVFLPVLEGLSITQSDIKDFSNMSEITMLCGRYEGIDERIKEYVDIEFRISNFIVNSSEIVVLFLLDAILRFLYIKPKLLKSESFYNNKNILDFPHYTRPKDEKIPEVLYSGHRQKIQDFRTEEQILRTIIRLQPKLSDFNTQQIMMLEHIHEKITKILQNKED